MKIKLTTLKIFISLVILFFATPLFSQQIAGRIIDSSSKEPLPFVNVINLRSSDSTLIVGTVTDDNGLFTLATSTEKHFMRISFMGYQTKDIQHNASNSVSGDIELTPTEEMLSAVVVRGRAQIFKMENGGISTTVANNTRLKNLGTANDVLGKLPFVFKDNGSITVVGKGTPIIYINNRLVRDMGELDRLSSNDIKKTTVITNPGPEYDATVSSVIVIETVRPIGEGLSGELAASGNIRRKFSHDENVSLNYRKGGFDIFGSGFYGGYNELNNKQLYQSVERPSDITEVKQGTGEGINTKNYNIEGGFNYIVSPKHSFGAKYTRSGGTFKPDIDIDADVFVNNQYYESFRSIWNSKTKRNAHLVNAYYNGKITNWLTAKFDFDYSTGNTDNWQNVNVIYQNTNETVDTKSMQDYDLYAGKLTLSTPLAGSNLVYGAEYSRTNNEQKFIVNENESAGNLTPNINVAKQNLFAAFASYSKAIDKFSLSAGLRFENVKFDYLVNNTPVKEQNKTYTNLFPNASVSYQNNNTQMMLSYRATTYRPGYQQLGNNLQYDGPYTYEIGNPFLKPTRVNDISFSFLWKDVKFMTSYKLYKNKSLYTVQQYENTNIILNKPENVKNSENLTVSAYYSPSIGLWQPTLGVNVMKDFLEYGTPSQSYNKPYVMFSLQNSLRFHESFVCGVDFRANTNGNSDMAYSYNSFRMNINLSKTFFNNKLIFNINVNDVLNTDRRKFDIIIQNARIIMDNDYDSRGIRFAIRYRFNSTSKKYKGSSAAGDELNRL